jgi:preprotein translocase YajC subunit
MGFLILIIVGFILMWLLIVVPQRRRQAAHVGMIEAIEPGDYVVTAGGIYGTVTDLGQEDVAVAPGVGVELDVVQGPQGFEDTFERCVVQAGPFAKVGHPPTARRTLIECPEHVETTRKPADSLVSAHTISGIDGHVTLHHVHAVHQGWFLFVVSSAENID